MKLIVGLGNPGEQYAHTRHNAGFDVVALLADKLGVRLSKLKCKAKLGEGRVGDERVVLAQPQTFMNLSGESVTQLVSFYKPDELIVCYDDVDLDFGRLRVRASGSAGTHNGMKSIIYLLGRDDFTRVRVGMGRPPEHWDLADFVLCRFETAEARKIAFDAYLDAVDALIELVNNGVDKANALAGERWRQKHPAPPKPPRDAKPKPEEAAAGGNESA